MAAAIQVLQPDWLGLTTALVSAYIANNRVPLSELPALITSMHASLTGLANPLPEQGVLPVRMSLAQARKSITPDGLISFEDGRSYKTLRRHLKQHDLTPAAYRAKWGLSDDYPMTAPSYSAMRSELARRAGLGQKRQATATVEVAKPLAASDTAKARGRRLRTRAASVMAE